MDLLLRIGGSLIGLMMVVAFLRSMAQVAIINRQGGYWLAFPVGRLAYKTIAHLARRRRTYDRIQDALAWIFPIYILLLIIAWFALVQAGFSLLIWSSQAEHSLLQAVIASGSALSTLGFLTPPGMVGQLLAIVEGATGLGIVVFYFTFIPGYQTTIQLRQVKVAWLYARAGFGLRNFTLIEWFLLSGASDWNGMWEDWECWFRELAETHALTPMLAFVPTVHRGQTWLAAAAVALDSVSLYLSALEAQAMPAATVCHRTGVNALRLIADELVGSRTPKAVAGRGLARPDFDAACDRLIALGAKVKEDRDTCWLRFAELRTEYEALLPRLADRLLVPLHESLLLRLTTSSLATASASPGSTE